MRQGLRWTVLGVAALAMGACGRDGGELRDATRERAERQQAELDSLRRDSAAAAQRAGMDTADALPVFVGPPVDSAAAAPVPAPAPEPVSETGDVGQDTGHAPPATPPPAPPAGAPGDWAMAPRDARRPGVSGTVTAMRAAHNEGFDRVTLVFDGARVPTYRVEYARQGVQQCGSGERVGMEGRAALLIHVSSRAHDDAGHVTVAARDQKPGLPVIKQVSMVCDFEGVVEVAVGVASPNKYRVVELGNPARLAVDVQQ